MAITMIDAYNVVNTSFQDSHLRAKLHKMVICTRMFQSVQDDSAVLLDVVEIDMHEDYMYQIEQDYEDVRNCIKNEGFEFLTGKMGKYIQPRTKGAGHGSTSRAFYARVPFLKEKILTI
jgi:DNA mismatch repair protein MutH